jgi:hypothetical protein
MSAVGPARCESGSLNSTSSVRRAATGDGRIVHSKVGHQPMGCFVNHMSVSSHMPLLACCIIGGSSAVLPFGAAAALLGWVTPIVLYIYGHHLTSYPISYHHITSTASGSISATSFQGCPTITALEACEDHPQQSWCKTTKATCIQQQAEAVGDVRCHVFRRKFALEATIGSHACSLESLACT